MAKNFYAVKRGYDKEADKKVYDLIFSDWSKAKPLVIGYDDARYKGFDTEEEAKVWLSVVDKTDAEKRAKKTIDKAKEEIGIGSNTNSKESDILREVECISIRKDMPVQIKIGEHYLIDMNTIFSDIDGDWYVTTSTMDRNKIGTIKLSHFRDI